MCVGFSVSCIVLGEMLLCRNRVLLIFSSIGWVCSYCLIIELVLYSCG